MATARLKRKLDSNDLAPASNPLESFCQIGTPLPSLDKKRDKNEFVPVWQQQVTDEQGRRRFHGAFTGGFSAGYFNSVGSAEGWKPSTFVSSRDARATKVQRAEDFMDDEDLEALRESQSLRTKEAADEDEGFRSAPALKDKGKGKEKASYLDDELPGMFSTPLPRPAPSAVPKPIRLGPSVAQPSQPLTTTWSDGRPLLPGFALDPKPLVENQWFAPPAVPDGWRPRPSRIWERAKKWDQTPADVGKAKAGEPERAETGEEAWRRRQAMSADKRAAALGEYVEPPPSPPPPPSSYAPFQHREPSPPPPPPKPVLSTPLSAMMANRFTTARAPIFEGGEGPIKAGLFVMDDAARAALAESRRLAEEERLAQLSRDRVPENETPLQQAARMGMYGALTREVKSFYPVKLLAKRVGVKAPHPDGPQGKDDAGAFAGPAAAEAAAAAVPVDPNAWQTKFKHVGSEYTPGQPTADERKAIEQAPPAEKGTDPILDYEKPPMDIFRAIFASDDEDSDDDDDGGGGGVPAPSTTAVELAKGLEPQQTTDSSVLPSTAAVTPASAGDDAAAADDDDDMVGPPPPPPPSALSASLDPASFRPTFKVAAATSADKPKKDRKKKDKKRSAAVLSFADEDGEGEEETAFDRERKEAERKERRERERKRREEKAREEWVEKPAAPLTPAVEASGGGGGGAEAAGRGRKRASDFL